jgi:putative membrane protein
MVCGLLLNKSKLSTMKKLSYVFMLAIAAYALQGCNGSSKSGNSDSTATTKDSTTMAKDTSKMAAATGNADTAFATKAANGGMAEVALGKLAQQKSTNADIKKFANMMVTDHGKANGELMAIAKSKNIALPATVDAGHQKKMDDLSKMTGKDFDKAYVDAMVDGHKKTLDLMNDEAKNGKDADLKAFAAKTAPTVQMHLDAINKIHDSMK